MKIYGDPEQDAAIVSNAPNLLVTAPPGCGKTDVLARRAAALIPRLQPGQRILALTFSNKARENLRARLREVIGTARLYQHVTVRNYHGHAMEVVRAHARTLGVPADTMDPPSRRQLKELEKRASQLLRPQPTRQAVQQALSELEEAKRLELDDSSLLDYLERSGEELTHQIELDRQQRGELHYRYGDLLRLAHVALGVEPIAKLYQHHYGAVLVDEFQDLTPQQLEIVLRTCTTSRTFAGDQFQGIYSWAGARPIEVSDTLEGLCAEHITLTRSYRSSPAVLEAVNAVAADLGAEHLLTSHDPEMWPEGGHSVAVAFSDENAEAQAITELALAITKTLPQSSVAIIARSDWRAKEVAAALEFTGVPTTHWDAPLESPEVASVLHQALERYPGSATVDEVAELLLDDFETEDPDHRSDIEGALETLARTGASSFAAAMQTVRNPEDERPVYPGVHLLNAHRGKGHQFDWVVALGLEEKHLPDRRAQGAQALREEEQILLVMLSRAKHGIVLTRRRRTTAPWGPDYPRASRWWPLFSMVEQSDLQRTFAHLGRHGHWTVDQVRQAAAEAGSQRSSQCPRTLG